MDFPKDSPPDKDRAPEAEAAKPSGPPPKWPVRFATHYEELLGKTEAPPAPAVPLPAAPAVPLPAAPQPPAAPVAAVLRPEPPARAPAEAAPLPPAVTVQIDALYKDLLKYCCDLAAAGITGAPIPIEGLRACAKDLLAGMKVAPSRLLSLSLENQSPGMFHHTANVTILSQYLARDLDASESALEMLCYITLLHDIGMYDIAAAHIEELTKAPRKHRVSEIQEWQKRLQTTLNIIGNIFGSDHVVTGHIIHWVKDIHDMKAAANSKSLPLACQIVRLAEIYEALTHRRPWREPLLPNVALHRIIQQKGQLLSPQIVELAVTHFTMFPPGSYMELSTGETAQVVSVNTGSLAKPLVRVINLETTPPTGGLLIDLLKNPTIHINRQIPGPSASPPSAGSAPNR